MTDLSMYPSEFPETVPTGGAGITGAVVVPGQRGPMGAAHPGTAPLPAPGARPTRGGPAPVSATGWLRPAVDRVRGWVRLADRQADGWAAALSRSGHDLVDRYAGSADRVDARAQRAGLALAGLTGSAIDGGDRATVGVRQLLNARTDEHAAVVQRHAEALAGRVARITAGPRRFIDDRADRFAGTVTAVTAGSLARLGGVAASSGRRLDEATAVPRQRLADVTGEPRQRLDDATAGQRRWLAARSGPVTAAAMVAAGIALVVGIGVSVRAANLHEVPPTVAVAGTDAKVSTVPLAPATEPSGPATGQPGAGVTPTPAAPPPAAVLPPITLSPEKAAALSRQVAEADGSGERKKPGQVDGRNGD